MKKLVIIAASTALALAACGDEESTETTTTEETTIEETSADTTEEPTEDEDTTEEETTDEETTDEESAEESDDSAEGDSGDNSASGDGMEFVATDNSVAITTPAGWYEFTGDTPDNFILAVGDEADNVNVLVQPLVEWKDVPSAADVLATLEQNVADATIELADESSDRYDYKVDAAEYNGYIAYVNIDGMAYEVTINGHRGENSADYADIIDTLRAK